MIPIILMALLNRMQVDASKHCPHHCLCFDSSHFVDCKGHNLSHIPGNIPHGTWILDLKHNDLTEIRAESFNALWSMKILILSNNKIEKIHLRAFQSFGFLEKLDLSHNCLNSLPHDFSASLVSLKELKLSSNRLEAVGFNSLQHFESLEKLDLSHNQIVSIERAAFRGLSRLRYLYLQSNRLAMVNNGFFFMLPNLEALLLGRNNITIIEAEAFTSLHTLNILGLIGNQLNHLKFKTFLNIHTPGTHLQLSENPWICDCDLQRVFGKILSVRHLHVDDYENISCAGPWQLAGYPLMSVDTQLCVAETATVLVITVTVLVTVIAAIVMAERNRKKNQNKNWNDSDSP
uniref:Si:ch211-237i5.4 n=2 Tax=Latimeria chalumnae TaxID=7897 RepID=H3B818_LATCH